MAQSFTATLKIHCKCGRVTEYTKCARPTCPGCGWRHLICFGLDNTYPNAFECSKLDTDSSPTRYDGPNDDN